MHTDKQQNIYLNNLGRDCEVLKLLKFADVGYRILQSVHVNDNKNSVLIYVTVEMINTIYACFLSNPSLQGLSCYIHQYCSQVTPNM